MKNILSPSILSADFTKIADLAATLDSEGVAWYHLDVMDGMFVPNISFGQPVIASLRGITKAFFDVHLMIEDPIRYVESFKNAGADMLTFHVEATPDIPKMIEAVKAAGILAGLSLNPDTDIEKVRPFVKDLDMVLVMSVVPGFGGQKFMPVALTKLQAVSAMASADNPDLLIEVDGGVNPENVREILRAGANVIVAGSAVTSGDVAANVRAFHKILEEEAR